MEKKEAFIRIKKLKNLINHYRYQYHVLDRSMISDEALDSLKKELFDLEQLFPDLITMDSPTQRVSGKPLGGFVKVSHPAPMISFNDAFGDSDMEEWLVRMKRLLTEEEGRQIDFFCELKIDGLAIELMYESQVFTTGATRGNGLIGEDVTQNLKTVETIPLKIDLDTQDRKGLVEMIGSDSLRQIVDKVYIRGEVFLSKREFEAINHEQEKNGLPPYANPRNVAAGSIRQLDSKVTGNRHLDSFAYELLVNFTKTHEKKHQILKAMGFKTSPHSRYCRNLKEVFAFYENCKKLRESLPYEIDGIVVIVNDNQLFNKLGVVGKTPRGAIAFKFPLKQATTIVLDIQAQVGRTGAITPVAHLKPVSVGGTMISRATLHNEDEIKRLGMKIGDTVIVGRAGDVIPDIIEVVTGLRTGKEKEFIMPKNCPSCKNKLERQNEEVVLRCANPDCFARRREEFYHFASRSAMNIVGLGPKIIDQLLSVGLVNNPADLYSLREEDLITLPNFGNKKADNTIKAINKNKRIDLARFIYALGIRNIGEETARDLAIHFKELKKIREAAADDFLLINGVGPVASRAVSRWFKDVRNNDIINRLIDNGIVVVPLRSPVEKTKGKEKSLSGQILALTGELSSMTREEARENIRQRGGRVSSVVGKSTNYLIVGNNPGSKLTEAHKYGVRIINESDFLIMIKK
ncbi:MAG: NAD-dependent DNA ligase LigA [bacterium]